MDRLKRLGLALAAVLLFAAAALPASAAVVPWRAPSPAAMHGAIVGSYPSHATMELYIRLQGRNEQQIDALIAALNTPGTSIYRRFLTPQQYGAYFGADPAEYARAIVSLRKAGFVIEALPANRTDIIASAPAQTVATYFGTPIDLRNERGRVFFANRFQPSFPPELRAIAVSGLDDYVLFHPHSVRRPNSEINGQFSWGPADIATAYDLNPLYSAKTPLDGKGVTIANATCGAASPSDFALFKSQFGLTAQLVTTGIGGTVRESCASYGNGESSLDVDSATGVARAATFHQVVAKSPGNDAFNRAYSYIVNDLGSTVHVVTTSWGSCEQSVKGTSSLTIDEKLFAQAATEGQAWFAASGDFGTDDCFDGYDKVSVDYPGSSKYVTDVGGTNVKAKKSPSGNVTAWESESTWQYSNSDGASGGGKSILFAKPSYQKALTLKDGVRDVPDVALLADNDNDGMWIAIDGGLHAGWGGTSEAAPQWAALFAIIVQKQGNKAIQDPHVRLYQLAGTAAYHELFHDITTGTNAVPKGAGDPYGTFPGYRAGRGFDLCTGLGSFVGAKLVQAY
jgi:kumamolisin